MEELRSKHRKELKSLDGERRSAMKKAKGMGGKGKKGKELIAGVEAEYAEKERSMKARHEEEVAQLDANANAAAGEEGAAPAPAGNDDNGADVVVAVPEASVDEPPCAAQPQPPPQSTGPKKSKAQKKREKARRLEREREERIAKENAEAGPSAKDLEMEALEALHLKPGGLRMMEVPADGNCLYRAVAMQVTQDDDDEGGGGGGGDGDGDGDDGEGNGGGTSRKCAGYEEMRAKCAEELLQNRSDYEPFTELEVHHCPTYETYVDRVRSTSEWGGQVELRALCHALKRKIVVYSADGPPIAMGEEFATGRDDEREGEGRTIRVSFHRRYYALGEHYNAVFPVDE